MAGIETTHDRFRGAMLGAALGDALGAPFEGSPMMVEVSLKDLDAAAEALRYTDDTHMIIGLAESLIECGGLNCDHLIHTFARNYGKEPWRGYGSGPPHVFRLVADGMPWDKAAASLYDGRGSFGNGAAMRVAPAALFAQRDLNQVADLARQSARVTHTHALAIDAAIAQASAVAVVMSLDTREAATAGRIISEFVGRLGTSEFRHALSQIDCLSPRLAASEIVQELGNGIAAIRSVPTALAAFVRTPDSFEEVVRFAISLGGDTDTIACMAGALAGARVGESALPGHWLGALENATQIRQLADGLYYLQYSNDLRCNPMP